MRRAAYHLPVVCLATVIAAADAAACTPPVQDDAARIMRSARHAVAWQARPARIPIGAHFVVDMAICAVDGEDAVKRITVDADMPEHRHGMNYRATVAMLSAGRYRAEGLMFHMPGRWRLTVELHTADSVDRLTDEFTVE